VAVVTALHTHAAWLVGRVGKYPKDVKHTLGQRTIALVIELIETSVEAAYVPVSERRTVLAAAGRHVDDAAGRVPRDTGQGRPRADEGH